MLGLNIYGMTREYLNECLSDCMPVPIMVNLVKSVTDDPISRIELDNHNLRKKGVNVNKVFLFVLILPVTRFSNSSLLGI